MNSKQALLFGRAKRAARDPAFAAPLARFSRVFSRYPPNGELARRIIQNKVFSQNVLSKIAVKEPLNHPRYDTVAGKILGALKNISG